MSYLSLDEISTSSTSYSHSTAPSTPPQIAQPPDILKFRSESPADRFERWRPSYHLMPSRGWMNDPCAPGYDPKTGLYHVSFQWNPNGADWGDIAWGSAVSPDMISWVVNERPSLAPDMLYDHKGVFTGCLVNARDGSLTLAYTSVSVLPVHYTIPHPRGCESLSVAKSFDNGKTWRKSEINPILPGEPFGLDVTGWRDPFCAPWPSMSRLLGLKSEETLFGIISGGIRDVTPTTFLYIVETDDLCKWNYLGPLTNFGLNLRPSRWSGDLGTNWEVTNFLTLNDEGDPSIKRDFLVMGTEGCLSGSHAAPSGVMGPSRPNREQLWMSGSLRAGQGTKFSSTVNMTYNFGGYLDHGCFYAANSFFDPKLQKHLIWGWITEDDLCDELRHGQGWSGMLSMPRELRLETQHHIVGALVSELSMITSIELEDDGHGAFTMRTLVSQPCQPLVKSLRRGLNARQSQLGRTKLRNGAGEVEFTWDNVRSTKWELECSIKISKHCCNTGVSVGHSKDWSRTTTLMFIPPSETFTIARPSFPVPNPSELINSSREVAPHTLFKIRDPATGAEDLEALHIRAWRDNSALEVFVNGRTAISTRLYAAEETFGMRFFADDSSSILDAPNSAGSAVTELLHAVLWDDISVT